MNYILKHIDRKPKTGDRRSKLLQFFSMVGCLFFLVNLTAQDVHFTQFTQTPLYFNPAMTGHIEGSYRIQAINREQWLNIGQGTAYSSALVSLDGNIGLKKSKSSIGIGMLAFNDRTGGGVFNSVGASGGFAYHLAFDRNARHFLSAGALFGILNKRLKTDGITFEDQFNGSIIDPSIPTSETLTNSSIMNLDLNAGLLWSSYLANGSYFRIGLAAAHLITAKESFYNIESDLPMRLTAQLETSIRFSPKLRLLPAVLYMSQATASQFNVGLQAKYELNPNSGISIGGGTRVNDAYYGLIGYNFKGLIIGASYDINSSSLKAATNGFGAIEFSLGYVGTISSRVEPIVPAIRFY